MQTRHFAAVLTALFTVALPLPTFAQQERAEPRQTSRSAGYREASLGMQPDEVTAALQGMGMRTRDYVVRLPRPVGSIKSGSVVEGSSAEASTFIPLDGSEFTPRMLRCQSATACSRVSAYFLETAHGKQAVQIVVHHAYRAGSGVTVRSVLAAAEQRYGRLETATLNFAPPQEFINLNQDASERQPEPTLLRIAGTGKMLSPAERVEIAFWVPAHYGPPPERFGSVRGAAPLDLRITSFLVFLNSESVRRDAEEWERTRPSLSVDPASPAVRF